MPATASAAVVTAGASASAAVNGLIAGYGERAAGGSALPRLVDVGLLRDLGVVEVGLGHGVDSPVPEQGAAAPLLVLEGRTLGLQGLDERGDVGGVGLPEPGHGVATDGKDRESSGRPERPRARPSGAQPVAKRRGPVSYTHLR